LDCIYCCRDIDEIGQDNMSEIEGFPICEDCFYEKSEIDFKRCVD